MNVKLIIIILFFLSSISYAEEMHNEHDSALSTERIPLQHDKVPKRPKPPLEIGNPFLGTGPISQGFTIPTGAVWQPSFMLFGTYRTAIQTFNDGNDTTAEWANRFDLFGNLYLTPTERVLAGIRFLDKKGNFSGYKFKGPGDRESDNAFNGIVTTLFFEGDLGELFPNLDKEDKRGFDAGFAIGRQELSFQDGMLLNDNVDAVGITKINIKNTNWVNLRSTFIWGGNELNRKNLAVDDGGSTMYGLFNEFDFRKSTVEFDTVFVEGSEVTGDGFFAGLGATQRLGDYNTTFRVLGSHAVGSDTFHVSDGVLLFGEVSWTPHGTDNHVYLTGFRGFDDFRSASRDPTVGGPLGQTGILFEAVGLGRYPAPLSNEADDAYGGALGYQMFFDETRKQLILEFGGRYSEEELGQRALGPGIRYQMAFGQRGVIQMDGFALYDSKRTAGPSQDDEYNFGARMELQYNF